MALGEDETVSESLFEKFNDLSIASGQAVGTDRIIRRITITKERLMCGNRRVRQLKVRRLDRANGERVIFASRSQESVFLAAEDMLSTVEYNNTDEASEEEPAWTLGISIVQGTDNNVYVKELVNGGPGSVAGICVGDQVSYITICKILNFHYYFVIPFSRLLL